MRAGPDGSAEWRTVRVARVLGMLATTALLAGCLGTSADGGIGGNGGDGYGGWGGNGYGGNGGNANGRAGADGAADAAGGGFSDPAAVAGSGRLISRTIDLAEVTSVVAEADFVVHLRAGGTAQAIVTMDDNLADRVDATVTGDQLRLGIKPGRSVRNATLSADVTVGRLDRLAASAASRVVLTSTINSPRLQVVVSGAGSVTGPVQIGPVEADVSGSGTLGLSGQVRDLRLQAVGAGRLRLADLTVRHLDATLSGASRTVVTVSDTLAVEATGASMLRYRGTPEITHSQTSGMSSVVADSP
ncbi:MAG: GIN domain-containing protein [Pseudonocardiaceae bacterium]